MARRPTAPLTGLPGTEFVRPDAPLEPETRGRRPAVAGAVLTAVAIAFSVLASIVGAVALVRAQTDSPYRTVQEAWEHGAGGDYALPLALAASQLLWLALLLVGFVLLAVALVRGHRRAWVWACAVLGPVGLAVSFGAFALAAAASAGR